ncbi:MAG: tetratricopeptide repeat protein [Catalinimonas sp.]
MNKLLILLTVLAVGGGDGLTRIARQNQLKAEAERAFVAEDYPVAIDRYRMLDSLGGGTPAATLNLAHAYYHAEQPEAAGRTYQRLVNAPDPALRSVAWQQLGVMAHGEKRYDEALSHFKEALRADPTNEAARRNYELTKQQKEQEQQQEQQDGENKDQQEQEENQENQEQEENQKNQEGDQDQQQQDEQSEEEREQPGEEQQQEGQQESADQQEGQEGEESDQPPQVDQEQLEKMNLSEEKARMILDAMRDSEIQYLQEKKHHSRRSYDPNRPDW